MNAHHVASSSDALREVVVGLTGTDVARRVVVADGKDGRVAEYCLAHDDADVDTHLRDATVGNAHLLDKSVVLVHQQNPKLLYVLVLQDGMHVVIYLRRCAQVRTLFHLLLLSTLAQFTGCHDGDGLGWPHAVVLAQVVNAFLAQGVQVVGGPVAPSFRADGPPQPIG